MWLDYVFLVNEGWYMNVVFLCRIFCIVEWCVIVWWNFGFWIVIRGEYNQCVIKLIVFFQCFIQIGEDIVYFYYVVVVRGVCWRVICIFCIWVVIEVIVVSVVVEEERFIVFCYFVEEFNVIFYLVLIQVFYIFWCNVGNGFLFIVVYGMNVIFVEWQFLDVFRMIWVQGDFWVDVNIMLFGIYIGY